MKQKLIFFKLPFIEAICWQTKNVKLFTLKEMLSCYERGWQYRYKIIDLLQN